VLTLPERMEVSHERRGDYVAFAVSRLETLAMLALEYV
jgi:hypothetical protein